MSQWNKVDVGKLINVIRKYNICIQKLKTGTVEGPCRNVLINHEINLHTLLHSPVLHLGQGILLHVKVDHGLVFGSHWEFSPTHSTVRFLRPLPHVTEHCNRRYEQYGNNVLGV